MRDARCHAGWARDPPGAAPGGARAGGARGGQPQRVDQHRPGLFAHPGHPPLARFGYARQLHRVAGDQHRLLHPVGAFHGDEHVAGGHVGVGQHLGWGEGRSGHHPGIGERHGGLLAGQVGRPRLQCRADDPVEVFAPAGALGEAGIVEPFGVTDQLGQLHKLVLAHQLNHQRAVAGAEGAEHVGGRVGFARLAHRCEVGDHVGHRQHRVQHGDVHVLALPGHLPLAQGGQHADHGEQAGRDVAERPDRVDVQRLVAVAFELVDARHALDDRGVGRARSIRAGRIAAEPGDRYQHRPRVDLGQNLRPQPQPVEGAGLEVLGDHIGMGGQLDHQLTPGLGLEIDADRVLAQVGAQKRRPHRSALGVGHRRG